MFLFLGCCEKRIIEMVGIFIGLGGVGQIVTGVLSVRNCPKWAWLMRRMLSLG